MRRILVFTLVWLAATTAAVAVAWAGVRVVSSSVVDPLPPRALAAVADAASGAAPSPPAMASPTPGAPVVGPSGDGPSGDGPSGDGPSGVPTAGEAPPPATGGNPTAPPTSLPSPDGELRSYQVVGGSVTLRFSPGRVTIVAAIPRSDDFDLRLEGNNTAEATVRFESDEHRSRVRGWWEDGPRDRVEEDDHSEDHD